MFKEANVTLMVRDFEKAFEFYTEVMGLTPAFRNRDLYAELVTAGLTVALRASGEEPEAGGQTISLGFTVERLEPAMEKLMARGVDFVAPGTVQDGGLRLAFFSDLDGNPLYLCELVQPL